MSAKNRLRQVRLGAELQKLRERYGANVDEVQKLTGIPRSQLAYWERGICDRSIWVFLLLLVYEYGAKPDEVDLIRSLKPRLDRNFSSGFLSAVTTRYPNTFERIGLYRF